MYCVKKGEVNSGDFLAIFVTSDIINIKCMNNMLRILLRSYVLILAGFDMHAIVKEERDAVKYISEGD